MNVQTVRSVQGKQHSNGVNPVAQIHVQRSYDDRSPQTDSVHLSSAQRLLNVRSVHAAATITPATDAASVSTGFLQAPYQKVNLSQAVRQQFGAKAALHLQNHHVFQWRVAVQGSEKVPNLQKAVKQQYSPNHSLVAVSASPHAWKAIDFNEVGPAVLPIMLVPSDKAMDTEGIDKALKHFKSNLLATQQQVNKKQGRDVTMLNPILVFAPQTAAQWNKLASNQVSDGVDPREGLLKASQMIVENRYPHLPEHLSVVIAPYTGRDPGGAASVISRGKYAAVSPRATAMPAPTPDKMDRRTATVVSSLANELWDMRGSAQPLAA